MAPVSGACVMGIRLTSATLRVRTVTKLAIDISMDTESLVVEL